MNLGMSKNKTRKKIKEDNKFVCAAFELEAVLSRPCTLIGDLYYKRCLSTYNLSFIHLETKIEPILRGMRLMRFIEILASDKSTRGRSQTIANAKLNALYGTKL